MKKPPALSKLSAGLLNVYDVSARRHQLAEAEGTPEEVAETKLETEQARTALEKRIRCLESANKRLRQQLRQLATRPHPAGFIDVDE